jgi:hypothetical protein
VELAALLLQALERRAPVGVEGAVAGARAGAPAPMGAAARPGGNTPFFSLKYFQARTARPRGGKARKPTTKAISSAGFQRQVVTAAAWAYMDELLACGFASPRRRRCGEGGRRTRQGRALTPPGDRRRPGPARLPGQEAHEEAQQRLVRHRIRPADSALSLEERPSKGRDACSCATAGRIRRGRAPAAAGCGRGKAR